MNTLMAFTTYANPPVRHVLFGKPFEEILFPVDCPGDEVVLRQWFFPLTEFTISYGPAVIVVGFSFAWHENVTE